MIKAMRTSVLAAAATASLCGGALPAVAAPAFEASPQMAVAPGVGTNWNQYRRYDNYDRGYNRDRYGRRGYDERVYQDTRTWRGRDGRYYCKRKNGTTGLLIGGAAGALVGNQIDGGHDRLLGTVLGGLGGALLGREVDRGGESRRCR
ncbi:MAG: glycine zipper 2TM domain-containing protein [Novosphingobium sp.]